VTIWTRFEPGLLTLVNHSGAAVPLLAERIKDRVPGAGSRSAIPSNHEGRNEEIPNGVYCSFVSFTTNARTPAMRYAGQL
jgi:hypothetical protein